MMPSSAQVVPTSEWFRSATMRTSPGSRDCGRLDPAGPGTAQPAIVKSPAASADSIRHEAIRSLSRSGAGPTHQMVRPSASGPAAIRPINRTNRPRKGLHAGSWRRSPTDHRRARRRCRTVMKRSRSATMLRPAIRNRAVISERRYSDVVEAGWWPALCAARSRWAESSRG